MPAALEGGAVPAAQTGVAAVLSARECGAVSAVAGQVQRDLLRCAAEHAELFPDPPFDPAFFGTVALAHAFCAPWLDATALRLTNRVTLWVFALDRLVDHVADSRSTVDEIVRRCAAVARGAAPATGEPVADPLGELLVELRDELARAPAYAALGPVWREELDRTLRAMAWEWDWKAGRTAAPPTLDTYLDNAESGFSLIFIAHWISTAGARPVRDVPALLAAARSVQRVTVLVNDLGSYRRDVAWGDVNALLLAGRAEIEDRLAVMIDRCRAELRPLAAGEHRPLALFLDRQIAFNDAFYRVTDYQAEPPPPHD